MFDEVRDNRLLTFLQRELGKRKVNDNFKNFYYCGTQAIQLQGRVPLVAIVKNSATDGTHTRFSGIQTCHNSWCCPKCTAKRMAQFGNEIACAIDALSTWRNQIACMITLTLPHVKSMSCKETFKTLKEAWRLFTRNTSERRLHKDRGTVRGNDIWGKFRDDYNIEHFVKIFEFTWGKNSWHPHIHMLVWLPKDKFFTCVQHEKALCERWWQCCKFSYLKYLNKEHPDNKIENRLKAESLYNEKRKSHGALYISKDELGRPIPQKSSSYISGWSSNDEMTQLHNKTPHKGHFNIFQILELAYKNRHNEEKLDKWMTLWIEHAETVKGVRRVDFSKSDIRQLIRKWKETDNYFETVKKKFMAEETGDCEVVGWFTSDDWNTLSQLERDNNLYIKAEVLRLGVLPNALNRINKYLKPYNIKLRHPTNTDRLIRHQLEDLIHDLETHRGFLNKDTA